MLKNNQVNYKKAKNRKGRGFVSPNTGKFYKHTIVKLTISWHENQPSNKATKQWQKNTK